MRNLRLTQIFNLSLVLLAIASLSLGCGGSSKFKSNTLGLPEWFQSPPEDPNYIFAVATSTSKDLQMSVNKGPISRDASILPNRWKPRSNR